MHLKEIPRAATTAGRDIDVWHLSSWFVLIGLTVTVCLTFRDYGITHDEYVQHTYSNLIWDLYRSGFSDRRVFDYIDLYRYGGLFDMVATALAPLLPFDHYETRHLLSAFCGIAGIAGTGRLARLLSGSRAGFFATVLLAATASYYGSMFNNTKDIPFAAGMIWTLYYAIRFVGNVPRPSMSLGLKFGVAFGLTIGIRVGVMMMPAYLLTGMAIWALDASKHAGVRETTATATKAIISLIPGAIVAYAIMAASWPWGVLEPLNPIKALTFFSHHPAVIESKIFGVHIVSSHTPWYYIPGYLLVKLPELTLILFAIGLAFVCLRCRRTSGVERAQLAVLTLATLIPLVLFVLFRPTVFNGLRHFFFVVPPMTVIAALAADGLWRTLAMRSRVWVSALAILLAGSIAIQARAIVTLHPDQYVYYNTVAGGLAGAQDRFEMDYWSNSIREVALLLTDRVRNETGGAGPAKPYKLALCTEIPSFFEFVPPGWFAVADKWSEGDFFVAPTQMACDRALDGDLIIVVERMNAQLAVVKDRRKLTHVLEP